MTGYYQQDLDPVGWCPLTAVSHAVRDVQGMEPKSLRLRNGTTIIFTSIVVSKTVVVTQTGFLGFRPITEDNIPHYVLRHPVDIEFALLPLSRYTTAADVDSNMDKYNTSDKVRARLSIQIFPQP